MFWARCFKDQSGSSAVEFAVIVSLLVGVLTMGTDTWLEVTRKQDMHTAVSAGAHYYMGGGANDLTAKSVVRNAWPGMPGDGSVTISRACTCGGAGAPCGVVCPGGGEAPEIQVTIAAQSAWNGMNPATLNESEMVRVR